VGQHGGTNTPETCLQCHPGPTWSGADFDHPASFDLLGAHANLGCTACHAADGTPLYPGVGDDECVACHQSDYDGQHGGSGYPTECLLCHGRSTWSGADFNHDADYFPIFSGKHMNKWNAAGCTACHPDASDFGAFTCFTCHAHDENRMSDKHSEVSGYSYEPERCLACHPTGSG
jgi:hypothetical protein